MPFNSKQVPISSKNSRAARNAHARARQEFKTYDTSAIQPKRSKAPMVVGIIAVVVIVVAIVLALVFLQGCAPAPRQLQSDEEAIVVVESGEGAKDIAQTLVDEGLITDANAFVDLINQQDAATSLIPGAYLFRGGTSYEDILDALLTGPASTADILTVPEGFTRQAIAEAIDEATGHRISEQEFLDATADASEYAGTFSFLIEAEDASLEGFLFPKTYTITATDDAKSVTRMMLSQYQLETEGLDWTYPTQAGLTEYEALILASIVEKEANTENRATVASVFYNRLASERPYLESDATTAYEVGHDPTADEVHADTPYSTYANPGLPPTPICNPSLEALQAVCSPEVTDYFYFFTYPDGSYAFSLTYDEHQEAIE